MSDQLPTLDPQLRALLHLLPDVDVRDLGRSRAVLRRAELTLPDVGLRWGVDVRHEVVPGPGDAPDVPITTYARPGSDAAGPVLLWVHGGGFVMGSAALEGPFCAEVAARTGVQVAAVDYRLAPEAPYPAGFDDCVAALRHLAQGGRAHIGVGGQSAGGALAVATALWARNNGVPIDTVVLEVPMLDDRLRTSSMQAFTSTPVWTRSDAEVSWRLYLGPGYEGPEDPAVPPSAAPARADDLRGLPPTYLATMELDPLRDEGLEFATRMLRDGVSVELHSFPGTFHRSSTILEAEVSRRFRAEIVQAVARLLATPS